MKNYNTHRKFQYLAKMSARVLEYPNYFLKCSWIKAKKS